MARHAISHVTTERKAYQGNHLGFFGRKANDVALRWHGMHNADGNGAVDFGAGGGGMQSFSLNATHTHTILSPVRTQMKISGENFPRHRSALVSFFGCVWGVLCVCICDYKQNVRARQTIH